MTEAEYRAVLGSADQFDIVRIRWRDSSRITFGWDSIVEYEKAIDTGRLGLEESTGFFVRSNDAFVLIVQSIREWPDDPCKKPHGSEGMMIPHEAIRLFEIIARGKDLDRKPGLDSPEASS